LLALLVAGKQWHDRPHGYTAPATPKWMQAIDTFGPGRSVAIALALSGVSPKNLLLTVGAAAAIAQAVFVIIGTLGVGAPVAMFFATGDRSAKLLGELRDWMTQNNTAIVAVLLVVIGAKLIGDGISVL
jgi:hypothetical protein